MRVLGSSYSSGFFAAETDLERRIGGSRGAGAAGAGTLLGALWAWMMVVGDVGGSCAMALGMGRVSADRRPKLASATRMSMATLGEDSSRST